MGKSPEKASVAEESARDYPCPPVLEDSSERIRVIAGGLVIADSVQAKRVLQTSYPPVYYIPPADIDTEVLTESDFRSFCEWKGKAGFYSLVVPRRTIEKAAWYYPSPTPRFAGIEGYVAFFPGKMDACYVDDEVVIAQDGDNYGGWITSKIVGPFKGPPGTSNW